MRSPSLQLTGNIPDWGLIIKARTVKDFFPNLFILMEKP